MKANNPMILFSNSDTHPDHESRPAWRLRAGAAAAALALLAAACGSDAAETAAAATDAAADAPADDAADATDGDGAMEDDAMAEDAMDDEAMADDAMDDAMADTSHADVTTASSAVGDILVDGAGLTLYGFTQDRDGQSVCNGDCAGIWPPLWVDGADVPTGLDPDVFSVITREDGSYQLAAGGWPLYTFANDAAPGDVNGQGVNDVWFVVAPDGALVMDAVEVEADAGSDY